MPLKHQYGEVLWYNKSRNACVAIYNAGSDMEGCAMCTYPHYVQMPDGFDGTFRSHFAVDCDGACINGHNYRHDAECHCHREQRLDGKSMLVKSLAILFDDPSLDTPTPEQVRTVAADWTLIGRV